MAELDRDRGCLRRRAQGAVVVPSRRAFLKGAIGGTALGLLACGRDPGPNLVSIRGDTMGSTYALKALWKAGQTPDPEEVARGTERLLGDLDEALSTWRDDSEIAALNRTQAGVPFNASEHLFAVLRVAQEISAQTQGAFDVTLAPVIRAWGFGGAEKPAIAPSDLEKLRGRVGWEALGLSATAQGGAVTKAKPGMMVDVSAVAPGYAADRLAVLLGEMGATSWMVEVGGEVATRGLNAEGVAWRIGVERPTGGVDRSIQVVVTPGDAGLATSGDYRNYYELAGRRVSHTIDPRTGYPIEHKLASVTVVDPRSCAHADAMATALNVLGPEEGVALAEKLGLAAYFIVREGDGFVTHATPSFAPLLLPAPSG